MLNGTSQVGTRETHGRGPESLCQLCTDLQLLLRWLFFCAKTLHTCKPLPSQRTCNENACEKLVAEDDKTVTLDLPECLIVEGAPVLMQSNSLSMHHPSKGSLIIIQRNLESLNHSVETAEKPIQLTPQKILYAMVVQYDKSWHDAAELFPKLTYFVCIFIT